MSLPSEVITTDHQLEDIAEKSSGQLARHRWHWTLNEANPDRVNVSEYARQVGRSRTTIQAQVNGYVLWLDENTTPGIAGRPGPSLGDHVNRAKMGAETVTAAEAVAKARGVGFSSARSSRPAEVRRVRETARQLAEERGTSVEEEAPKVAEVIARAEKAAEASEAERREHADMRFFEMERYLISAKRELMRAVKLAPQVPWDDEHRELLGDTVGNVKALLGLIDAAIAGISGTDWDAELAKIGEQA